MPASILSERRSGKHYFIKQTRTLSSLPLQIIISSDQTVIILEWDPKSYTPCGQGIIQINSTKVEIKQSKYIYEFL